MHYTPIRDVIASKPHNWVLWGRKGSLQSLENRENVRTKLREAHARARRDAVLRRQIYPEFGDDK